MTWWTHRDLPGSVLPGPLREGPKADAPAARSVRDRVRPDLPLPPTVHFANYRPSGRGDLSLDPARRVAVRAGRRLPLTPKELSVLECLLAADGRPVPAEELLERVWDEAADPFTTTVKTTIGRSGSSSATRR